MTRDQIDAILAAQRAAFGGKSGCASGADFAGKSGQSSSYDFRPGGATYYEKKEDSPPKNINIAPLTGFAAKILDGAQAVDFVLDERGLMQSSRARDLQHCFSYGSRYTRNNRDFTIEGRLSPQAFREMLSFRLGDFYVPRRRFILNCTCKINGVNQ